MQVVKKADYNAKITEIENKIPNINSLATNAVLTAVENKMPDVSGLVKKNNKKKQILRQKLLKLKNKTY